MTFKHLSDGEPYTIVPLRDMAGTYGEPLVTSDGTGTNAMNPHDAASSPRPRKRKRRASPPVAS